ncbi:AraC family transcriptional regulator [Pendulispora brunnea]|uniref:AraC family transcriptional regulator n=1 Tax=Pendulispora brunnea TaxID=2905690 RepID=A0ABZ2JUT7_9BACT
MRGAEPVLPFEVFPVRSFLPGEEGGHSMRYRVCKPSPPLRGIVDYLWYLSDVPDHARERIVPSGTIELVINLQEDEFRIYGFEPAGEVCHRFPGAMVSGCYGTSFGIDTREHASVMGVHFRPGGVGGLLGAPPGELADAHVGLDALWGARAIELRERLCAAADSYQRFRILEGALFARLRRSRAVRDSVRSSLSCLDRPEVEIGEITRTLGLSRRRFIEIFTEDVGMTPKRYSRVRRFQRALALTMQSPRPKWSRVALECGYFDQAHLCRDWVELTGVSPGEFLALRRTHVKENHVALSDAG